MEILYTHEALADGDDEGEHLRMQPLAVLTPEPDPYRALVCQPNGTIRLTASRIGNEDPASVVPMYRSLLQRAIDQQVQLVVTPEYSVPWPVIQAVLDGEMRPPKGALWALGCESITLDELDDMHDRLIGRQNVRLVHEPLDEAERAAKQFVDPLAYVFWAWDHQNEDVLCVLVQFKTVASRSPGHVELTSMYRGTRVYKFETAGPQKISLLSLICSDAFEFSNALVDDHCSNLLLLHIQLNQRPAQTDFAAYRQRLYAVASNNNVEVLVLNWAVGVTTTGDNGEPWNSIAGSAWYAAPGGVRLDDEAVLALHDQGVYYSLVGPRRWHAFYLNFSPHALLVQKQRVFSGGPQVIAPRIAPIVVDRVKWDSQGSAWTPGQADDGFDGFVQTYDRVSAMLPSLRSDGPLAVERALELLAGPKGEVTTWYRLEELAALRVGHEESIRRVTVCQESNPARDGVQFRRALARKAQTAASLPDANPSWPPAVRDLAGGYEYRWSEVDPHCNVLPDGEEAESAALVYLGEDPEDDLLQNVHAKVLRARQHHAIDSAQDAALAGDRLCIAYKRDNDIEFYRPPHQTSITSAGSDALDDISGDTA